MTCPPMRKRGFRSLHIQRNASPIISASSFPNDTEQTVAVEAPFIGPQWLRLTDKLPGFGPSHAEPREALIGVDIIYDAE